MALQNVEANITLDLYNHDTTPATVKAIQLDSETRYVAARLQNVGVQYDVDSGATVQLIVVRPDKVGVQIMGTTFTYGDEGAQFLGTYAELTQVALAVNGKMRGQFKITSGDQILRTEIFAISNGEALDASTDEWADEYDGYNLEEMATSIETNTADIASLEADVSQIKEDLSEYGALDVLSNEPKQNRTVSGITYTWTSPKTCDVTGTATAQNVCAIYNNTSAWPSWFAKGHKYRVYYTGNKVSLKIWFYKNGTYQSGYTVTENCEIETPSDSTGLVIRLQVENGAEVNETVSVSIYDDVYTNKELTDIVDGEKTITVNLNTPAWSNGYINTSTGEFVSSPTAITTDNYIQGKYTVRIDSGKSIAYSKYKLDGTFVSRSNWLTTEQILNPDYKYRLSMRTEPYSSGLNSSVGEYGKCQIIDVVTIDDFIRSRFYGKRVSILGDSISTFDGTIPSGNVTYYPSAHCPDILSSSQIWWKRVVDALGMTLLVNNSYSGGRVAVAGDSAGRAIVRCDALDDGTHDPDIIFFFMGTNDFNTNVTIGTYDGTGDFPTESDSTFRASYAQVLKKMMTAYPLAEIYCMTILPCERMLDVGFPEKNERGTLNQYNDAIRELANLFNCKVLDVDKCGITYFNISSYMGDYNYPSTGQGLHPNGNGHKLIADYIIKRFI